MPTSLIGQLRPLILALGMACAFPPCFALAEQPHRGANYESEAVHDHAKDAKLLEMSAYQGNAAAQVKLGDLYYGGVGVVKNFWTAAFLYGLASEQNGGEAHYKLGVMYKEGLAVDSNSKEAARLFKLAADQGITKMPLRMGSAAEQ